MEAFSCQSNQSTAWFAALGSAVVKILSPLQTQQKLEFSPGLIIPAQRDTRKSNPSVNLLKLHDYHTLYEELTQQVLLSK